MIITATFIRSFSQTADSEINLVKINTILLEELFMKKLNTWRQEQKVGTIQRDAILRLAAQDQATFMRMQKKITHSQPTKGKETTNKRVAFYKGTHDGIAENCTAIYLKKLPSSKNLKNSNPIFTYIDAANALFHNWQQSEQGKIMADKSHDVYGMGFHLSGDSVLYATQVFAQKPYVVVKDKAIKDTDYGILPNNPSVCDCMKSDAAYNAKQTLLLQNHNGMIYIKSENLQALKNFFSGAKDALYLDIVLRNQFGCDNNNLIHGSKIYDGTMLKPVLFSEIYAKNQAKDNINLFAPLSQIPEYFKNQNYAINIGYVKNGYSCDYGITYSPPNENFGLLHLWPKWIYQEHLDIIPGAIDTKIKLFIPFKRNETSITAENKNELLKKLAIYEPAMKQVNIKTYSSVEGSEENNVKLQEKRAQELKLLLSSITKKQIKIELEVKENWDDFFRSIQKTPFAYLQKLSKPAIKEHLKRKTLLDSMDYILKASRISNLELEIVTEVNNTSSPELILAAYQHAVLKQDSVKAFRAQNRLLESAFKYQFSRPEILNVNLPYKKRFLPMWTNYLALHLTNTDENYFYSARDTALKAIRIDSTYMPLQFNFCLLALNHLCYYADTIIPINQLEYKMNKAYKMAKNQSDSALVNHMWLNYSVLSLYRHWELHQYDKINKHLLNVKKYYPKADITEPEAVGLGLLFNFYSRFDWTLELLLPYLKKGSQNEDLLFTYLQSYGFEGTLPKDEWAGYLKKAKRLNSQRFNYWIDQIDFQNLRAKEIKKEFCE